MTWNLANGRTVMGHASRLERWRPDLPPGSDISVPTTLARLAPVREERDDYVLSVLVEYSDEQRVGRWRQVWRPFDQGDSIGSQYFVPEEPELLMH